MTPEHRAKIGEANRKRWQDPEYRAANLPKVKAYLSRGWGRKKVVLPAKGTPERRVYNKLYRELGAKAARAELGI